MVEIYFHNTNVFALTTFSLTLTVGGCKVVLTLNSIFLSNIKLSSLFRIIGLNRSIHIDYGIFINFFEASKCSRPSMLTMTLGTEFSQISLIS